MGAKLEQDHIVSLATPDSPGDVITNYQWLCARPPHGNGCHWAKTQREIAAGKARAQAKRGSLSRKYRDLEPHPGRLPT